MVSEVSWSTRIGITGINNFFSPANVVQCHEGLTYRSTAATLNHPSFSSYFRHFPVDSFLFCIVLFLLFIFSMCEVAYIVILEIIDVFLSKILDN